MFTNLTRPGARGLIYDNYIWRSDTGADIVMAESDRPSTPEAWIDDSGVMRTYRPIQGTKNAAESPTPCFFNTAQLSEFSDNFDDNSIDLCRWTAGTIGNGNAPVETGGQMVLDTNGLSGDSRSFVQFYMEDRSDIDISFNFASSDQTAPQYFRHGLRTNTVGMYFGQVGGSRGIFTYDGSTYELEEAISSGTGLTDRDFRVVLTAASGGTANFYLDGGLVRTATGVGIINWVRLRSYNYHVVTPGSTEKFDDFVIAHP